MKNSSRMKQYLSTVLGLVCVVLVIILIVLKSEDNAQHQTDTGAIADFSNQLDSAQTQISIGQGTLVVFSNNLVQSQSAAATFSNQLDDAQSTIALDAEQITNLTGQVAGAKSENETLSRTLGQQTADLADLTNQVAGLTTQLASTQASLNQANTNYTLLENRFRRDVAERVLVERKFNDNKELRQQIKYLKTNPSQVMTTDSIYAGLGVEVNSDGSFHVISPN
jgi:chromosome segregation ATPase